jgi:hypothetical protein
MNENHKAIIHNESPRSKAARYRVCHSGLSRIFLEKRFPTSGNDKNWNNLLTPVQSIEEFLD